MNKVSWLAAGGSAPCRSASGVPPTLIPTA